MAAIQYDLNDYNAILFGNYEKDVKFTYTLPKNVISIIHFLAKKFAPSEIQEKTKKTHVNRTENSWINTQTFKPTIVIDKNKPEGTEKTMNDIRSSLNKISNKNYETNRDVIIGLLNELIRGEKQDVDADLMKIGNNIFDIASTNKFFSDIYAKLYKDISEKFPEIFNSILAIFLEGFTNTMKTICYVDQKDNYDDFCKYNKDNDKRKATSMFITNLVKNEVIHPDVLINIIVTIQGILHTYMNEENRVNEVEEIIENIYILLTNNIIFLKSCKDTEIMECMIRLSKLKPKELPSMSSRAIFKCLDIVDKINK